MSAHLVVTGEDAADFLQSQFSCDLRPFATGKATYGLWLDVKGRVIADSWVLCLGQERFHLLSEHSAAQTIADKLKQHVIADDVSIELAPPAPVLSVIGATVEALSSEFPGFALFPGRRANVPSVEAVFESITARDAFATLTNGEMIGGDSLELLRLESGYPRIPMEAGPGELPGEAGLDRDAVDFNKGCFLGQEVVARMRNLGKPTRALYILEGAGSVPKCPELLTRPDGKALGELRSAFENGSGWRGVALLKIRYITAEAALRVAGKPAEIVGLLSGIR